MVSVLIGAIYGLSASLMCKYCGVHSGSLPKTILVFVDAHYGIMLGVLSFSKSLSVCS